MKDDEKILFFTQCVMLAYWTSHNSIRPYAYFNNSLFTQHSGVDILWPKPLLECSAAASLLSPPTTEAQLGVALQAMLQEGVPENPVPVEPVFVTFEGISGAKASLKFWGKPTPCLPPIPA